MKQGKNVSIHPLAFVDENVNLGDDVIVGPFTQLIGDCLVVNRVKFHGNCYVSNSEILSDTHIMPFAKIEGSYIGTHGKIGCQMRNSTVGNNIGASHPEISMEKVVAGDHINFGAQVVFCAWGGQKNETGQNLKSHFKIGSRCFIGAGVKFMPQLKGDLTRAIGSDVWISTSLDILGNIDDGHTVLDIGHYHALLRKDRSIEDKVVQMTDKYVVLKRNKMLEDKILQTI